MTKDALVGGLVVTHGQLGQELVVAAETIVGGGLPIVAVSLGWDDDVVESQRKIKEAVQEVDKGKGVIILTDMFGGTPSNLALPLLKKGELEIVTGVNLPMIIKLANQSSDDALPELAARVKQQGQKHIVIASKLLGE